MPRTPLPGATITSVPPPATPADPYAPVRSAAPDKPFVVAQLGQSLDGRIATPTGESRWINQSSALDHVHRLRATVDAVVVGVGTVVADDPLLNVRRVSGRHPVRVVIDPSGRCPPDAKIFNADGVRRIVIRAPDAKVPLPAGVEVIEIGAYGRTLAPGEIVSALHRSGINTMLVEGGAWTVSQFIDAGVVDRLHVMVAPMILGSGKTGLELRPIARLSEAKRPTTNVHVMPDGDVLFDCDLRSTWEGEKA